MKSTSQHHDLRVPLSTAARWHRFVRLAVMLLVSEALVATAIRFGEPSVAGAIRSVISDWMIAVSGVSLAGLFAMLWSGPRWSRPAAITLDRSSARIPLGRFSAHPRRIRYGRIYSIERISGRFFGDRLSIGALGSAFPYPIRKGWLSDPEDLDRLEREIRARVAALPDGPERLETQERRRALGDANRATVPWVSWGCAAAILVAFAIGRTWFDRDVLIRWGGASGWLVPDGGAYRLVTSLFLHGNLAHAATNAMGFVLLGRILEGALGHWRTALILVASGIGGQLTYSLSAGAGFGIGASPAIYGLAGAFAVLNVFRRSSLPASLRMSIWIALWIVLLEFQGLQLAGILQGLDRSSATINVVAHLGGLIVGALASLAVLHGVELKGAAERAGTRLRLAVVILAATGSVALVYGLGFLVTGDDSQLWRARETLLLRPDADPEVLVHESWEVYRSTKRRPQLTALARSSLRRAEPPEWERAFYSLVEGSLAFREADLDAATRILLDGVWEYPDDRRLSTQLARVLALKRASLAPSRGVTGSEFVRREDPSGARWLQVGDVMNRGGEIHALAFDGDCLIGSLLVALGTNPEDLLRIGREELAGLPAHARLEVGLLQAVADEGEPSKERAVRYHPLDAEVSGYPGPAGTISPLECTARAPGSR